MNSIDRKNVWMIWQLLHSVSIDDHGTQPWEKQPHSGLVGGDVLPGDQKNANKNADVKWPNAQVPYVISSSFSMC